MPSRIELTDEQIASALEATGGRVASAADILRISSRTLSRRLAANSDLRPCLPVDPVWERGVAEIERLLSFVDPRYGENTAHEHYRERVDFTGDEVEDEPRILSAKHTIDLINLMVLSGIYRRSAIEPHPPKKWRPLYRAVTWSDG